MNDLSAPGIGNASRKDITGMYAYLVSRKSSRNEMINVMYENLAKVNLAING